MGKKSDSWIHYLSVSKEAKVEVSHKNTKSLAICEWFVMAFSFVIYILTVLNHSNTIIRNVYYLSLFFDSVIAEIAFFALRKSQKYYLNQAITIFVISIDMIILGWSVLLSSSTFGAAISVYIACLLLIIYFDITPYFFVCLLFLVDCLFVFLYHLEIISFSAFVNNFIFSGCFILLSFYKRQSTVRNIVQKIQIKEQNRILEVNNIELEHQKDSLLVSKQYLEDAVFNQSQELQLQNERLIRIQNNTIVSLSNLVENRDEDTGEHVLRTRDYVELIALKARTANLFENELSEEKIRLFIKAAPMHDIGKIVVPDSILKKPGKLTPEEFDMIKLHTSKGGKIVEDVLGAAEDQEYVKIAKEIATYHHEKFNGTGYPEGLKGYEIPLSARIMAIADVFDALVSPRCYKEPMPVEKAFSIIEESAGSHFDPDLAKLFLDAKDDVVKIMKKYEA